jgi:hypothetical protein
MPGVLHNMKYLKIHTLKKGWQDRDEIVLHAVFQILVDFVEQEKPDEIVDWNADDTYKQAWREICELYKWWKTKRPARKSPLDDKRLKVPPIIFEDIPGTDHKKMVAPDKKKYAAYYKALEKHWQQEKEWHDQDQQNLHRLIEIRPYLWT